MAYNPPDCEELFRTLGPEKTRRGIINGYFDPETSDKGRLWLSSVPPWASLKVTTISLLVAGVSTTVAIWAVVTR